VNTRKVSEGVFGRKRWCEAKVARGFSRFSRVTFFYFPLRGNVYILQFPCLFCHMTRDGETSLSFHVVSIGRAIDVSRTKRERGIALLSVFQKTTLERLG
jgi:hypothetical protein